MLFILFPIFAMAQTPESFSGIRAMAVLDWANYEQLSTALTGFDSRVYFQDATCTKTVSPTVREIKCSLRAEVDSVWTNYSIDSSNLADGAIASNLRAILLDMAGAETVVDAFTKSVSVKSILCTEVGTDSEFTDLNSEIVRTCTFER